MAGTIPVRTTHLLLMSGVKCLSVVSSVNIPTIPLSVAQAMDPAPRPPSPTARDAMQKVLRHENPNQLSTRDARILMGLPSVDSAEAELQPSDAFRDDVMALGFETGDTGLTASNASTPKLSKLAPPRPIRESRRTTISSDLVSTTFWCAFSHLLTS